MEEATVLCFEQNVEVAGKMIPSNLASKMHDVSLDVEAGKYSIVFCPIGSAEFFRIVLNFNMTITPTLAEVETHSMSKLRYHLRIDNREGKYVTLNLVTAVRFSRWHGTICQALAELIFAKAFGVMNTTGGVIISRVKEAINRCKDVLLPADHLLLNRANRVLIVKAVVQSLLVRLSADPKQVYRAEVSGLLQGIRVGELLPFFENDNEVRLLMRLERSLFTQDEIDSKSSSSLSPTNQSHPTSPGSLPGSLPGSPTTTIDQSPDASQRYSPATRSRSFSFAIPPIPPIPPISAGFSLLQAAPQTLTLTATVHPATATASTAAITAAPATATVTATTAATTAAVATATAVGRIWRSASHVGGLLDQAVTTLVQRTAAAAAAAAATETSFTGTISDEPDVSDDLVTAVVTVNAHAQGDVSDAFVPVPTLPTLSTLSTPVASASSDWDEDVSLHLSETSPVRTASPVREIRTVPPIDWGPESDSSWGSDEVFDEGSDEGSDEGGESTELVDQGIGVGQFERRAGGRRGGQGWRGGVGQFCSRFGRAGYTVDDYAMDSLPARFVRVDGVCGEGGGGGEGSEGGEGKGEGKGEGGGWALSVPAGEAAAPVIGTVTNHNSA